MSPPEPTGDYIDYALWAFVFPLLCVWRACLYPFYLVGCCWAWLAPSMVPWKAEGK